jgi:peptide/nickel transport system permease protein
MMEPLTALQITTRIVIQLWPVWAALALQLGLSFAMQRRLGLYGRLFRSPMGISGLILVMIWVYAAIFAPLIITHDPLTQLSGMKHALPGSPLKAP